MKKLKNLKTKNDEIANPQMKKLNPSIIQNAIADD